MKKKFRNNYEPSVKQPTKDCYEAKIVHGQVLTNREIIKRGLYGNIVDKVVNGSYIEADLDSPDIEDLERMDLIDKVETIEKLGELQSYRENEVQNVMKQKQLEKIKEKELADKQFRQSIQDVIDNKKIEGK